MQAIYQILEQYWAYKQFRPLQEEIIQAVLSKNDVLALMPTGGGKSICFQVPAMLNDGICLVISPLIALMQDQVENLNNRGIAAQAIFSGMSKIEIALAFEQALAGKFKFLYLSPERLLSAKVLQYIAKLNINLVAIDEAHCISQWGYDFRPSYLRIHEIRKLLPNVPFLALTATANERVRNDIIDKLHLKAPQVLLKSFFRANISYVVLHQEDKLGKMLSILQKITGTGIVYARKRRDTIQMASYLNRHGISSEFYHAGLSMKERADKQYRWKNNETTVMVATNAFGMGIDKNEVRVVIHLDLPESMEAYFQEAGRAGRDEKKAYAVLLTNEGDIIQYRKQVLEQFPSLAAVQNCYHQLGNYFQIASGSGLGLSFDFELIEFCKKTESKALLTIACLKILMQAGYLQLNDAVFIPSRLKIEISYYQLNVFQEENAYYEPLIKTILRSYGSVFDQYVFIHEQEIANRIQISIIELKKQLLLLENRKIISYLPQTEAPQLVFLSPRIDAKKLQFDFKFLEQRKKSYLQQATAMLDYVSTKKCRSSLLLNYFAEPDSPACGICDVCIANKKLKLKEKRTADLTQKIYSQLKEHQVEYHAIFDLIEGYSKVEITEVLNALIDATQIHLKDNNLILV